MNMASALPPDHDRGPRRAVLALLGSIALFFLITGLWMSLAKLDIAVQASGKVIPSSRVQEIQSMEGGIIQAIAVKEGQMVKRGDLLARLQNLQFNSDLGESRQNYWGAQAALARLDAEIHGRAPVFSKELTASAPQRVAEQQALWHSRMRERDNTNETLRKQLTQREEELAEIRSRIATMGVLLVDAKESLAMEDKLMKQGAGARADYLTAKQRVSSQQGDLDAARVSVQRLQAAIHEARSRLAEADSRFIAEASRERSDLELKAATTSQQITAQADRVSRRELLAPMDGIVNRVLLTTVGGVAQAGQTLMELVPAQDSLLISARVKPADIAFIHPGQIAKLRISAYDSSIFGTLEGKVKRVGADALLDKERQESYFEVILEADRNYLGAASERLTISPGMAADASILTGKRTPMEYLLKPVIKTLDKSLRER
ncbi:MAG: HlyD family type I secretion periplasmic adaptor subunit [Gallionellaceae bacterium]|nr:HlyD family type I secretion periplasmic adaptor subunit [Gallionellaceae bacterium]